MKPFDKVLVRDGEDDVWRCNIFSHMGSHSELPYVCLNDSYYYYIPYEGNEHLLGTTRPCEADLPNGMPVMVADSNRKTWLMRFYAGNGYCYNNQLTQGLTSHWHYIIPFDKFNPVDIESSLKYSIV